MRSALRLAAALALAAAGCGSPGKAVAPVSGRVTLDGKPLANATVTFQPIAEGKDVNPGPGSYGKTDADGRYALRVVGEELEGAYVGRHRVEVQAFARERADPNSDTERAPPSLVPRKYNFESTLTFEVKPGGSTDANFELMTK
jgi:hypothetical protein